MRKILSFAIFAVAPVMAGSITLSGTITQSAVDGGSAVNNTSLNNIADGQAYTVVLNFAGAITIPGNYNLTGSSLLFSVAAAPAMESSFNTISLTIQNFGAVDDLTLLGCLTTGTACNQGNYLSAIFQIPAASLNGQGVVATGLDQPHPLDLLEDDGTTDTHGSITSYSYQGITSTTPEPSTMLLCSAMVAALVAKRFFQGGQHQ